MIQSPLVCRAGAAALCRTIADLRTETLARCVAGSLAVCADDLLRAAGTVESWLTELNRCVRTGPSPAIMLPVRDEWELQNIVYTISAVLAWADCLHQAGELTTAIEPQVLQTWDDIEVLAGMGGRTMAALAAGYGEDRTGRMPRDIAITSRVRQPLNASSGVLVSPA